MTGRILKNKPLAEAIFELHWQLEDRGGILVDPHYRLLVGRLYDRLAKELPFHEELPTASVPDEVLGHIVQHRFRPASQQWPVVQVGPGILTANETSGYTWPNFEKTMTRAVGALYDAYPNAKATLRPRKLMLRYIDAIEFNFAENDVWNFVRDEMHTRIELAPKLPGDGRVGRHLGFDLQFAYEMKEPTGLISVRLARGKHDGKDAIILEFVAQTIAQNGLPSTPSEIVKWAQEAHELTGDWFFNLIDGKLRSRFE